jgi:hypothetical protein
MRIMFFALLPILIFTNSLLSAQSKSAPYYISKINAYLVYNQSGKMSENLIDNESFILWNTVIGEGNAAEPSTQTLVIVEISGNPKEYTQRDVRLTVMNGSEVFFKQSVDFVILDENSKYYAAFLLYNTGCSELKLTAEILNKTLVESKLIKTIPFHCGE